MSAPEVRPRYGRIAVFGASVVVTATALLSGVGVLPSGGTASYAAAPGETAGGAAATLAGAEQRVSGSGNTRSSGAATGETTSAEVGPEELLVPEDSGEGRRVVFSESAQRVWLVKADDSVERTYLVSGSVYDNLDPGTYSVFSRDKQAWGTDGSELRFMVRFTTGADAAIGFHNIPVLDGEKVQTRSELGTPLSDGSVRQWSEDAKALWGFAPLGATVIVVA